MRTLSLCAALALLAPAAHAQTASADWEQAYRLVLARDWRTAIHALDRFVDQYPAHESALQARFWRCYADEQLSQFYAASTCYRALIDTSPDTASRWHREARGRLVVVNTRLQPGAAASVRSTHTSTVNGTTTVVQIQDGKKLQYVVRRNANGTVDTLSHTVSDMDEAELAAWEAAEEARESAREAVEQAREAAWEAQQTAAEAQRDAAQAQREAAEALRGAGTWATSCVGGVCTPTPPAPPTVARVCTSGDCSGYAYSFTPARADTLTDEERVAVLAVEALGRQGNAEAVPDLRDLATSARSVAVRMAALNALARVGTPDAVRAVVEAARRLDGLSQEHYGEVVAALVRIGTRQPATPGLVDALDRIARLPNVRAAAVQGLSRLQTDEATDALWRIAEDNGLSAEKRSAALGYLVRRNNAEGTQRAIVLLERFVRSSDLEGAQTAAQSLAALQQSSSGDAATRLMERLADDASVDVTLRSYFVQTLVRTPTPRTVPLLRRLARDADRYLAQSAVQSLGRLNTPEARQALLDLARGQ